MYRIKSKVYGMAYHMTKTIMLETGVLGTGKYTYIDIFQYAPYDDIVSNKAFLFALKLLFFSDIINDYFVAIR